MNIRDMPVGPAPFPKNAGDPEPEVAELNAALGSLRAFIDSLTDDDRSYATRQRWLRALDKVIRT